MEAPPFEPPRARPFLAMFCSLAASSAVTTESDTNRPQNEGTQSETEVEVGGDGGKISRLDLPMELD